MYRIFAIIAIALTFSFNQSYAQKQHFVGMDLSLLPNYEIHNKPYLDKDGNEIPDMLAWLPSIGVNSVRVRIFVNPTKKNQKGERDIAVCQDLDYVKTFGARIKAAGLNFMLDFHYSDTWADPSSQITPASWSDCKTAAEKAARVYEYTKDVLQALKESAAEPDFVQVGNEISYGIVDIKNYSDWNGFQLILEQGCKAVREICPAAKIVIHSERSGDKANAVEFFKKLASLDYDIIGLSYYPFWHGLLPKLEETLSALAADFPQKEVQIVETAYNYQYSPNPETVKTSSVWPYNETGQEQFIEDLVSALNKYNNVSGLYYWFAEEAGNGDDTNWNAGGKATVLDGWCNRGLWHHETSGKGHRAHAALFSLQGFSTTALDHTLQDAINQQIYNLSGQKISHPAKGEIYIENGKKMIKE